MNAGELLRAPWMRGLLFGTVVGLIVVVFNLIASAPGDKGGSRADGTGKMGRAEAVAVEPALSPRDRALTLVAVKYIENKRLEEADRIIRGIEAGPGRDQALDMLIDAKLRARQGEVELLMADREKASAWLDDRKNRQWLDELRRDTERMSPSITKVERLIKLAEFQTDPKGPFGGEGGAAPAGTAKVGNGADDPTSPAALLARAEAVAHEVPNGWSRFRPLLAVLAFGLIGMTAGWAVSTLLAARPAQSLSVGPDR